MREIKAIAKGASELRPKDLVFISDSFREIKKVSCRSNSGGEFVDVEFSIAPNECNTKSFLKGDVTLVAE